MAEPLSTKITVLVNEINAAGTFLEQMVTRLEDLEWADKRWVGIGRQDLQTGLMALRRAIERPAGF